MTTVIRPTYALLAAIGGLAALLAAAGCGSATADVSSAPDPTVVALQQRAALAANLAFTGTYAVADTSHTKATVRVWVTPKAYRVEVSEGTVTAALYGTPTGTVACPEQVGQTTVCFAVAGAGKPVPPTFDAGIQRVFTRDLPALAAGAGAFQVTAVKPSATVAKIAAGTSCYQVERLPGSPPLTNALAQLVDQGTYCLAPDGVPTQLQFASGTLTLTRRGAAPAAAALKLPAPAQALPVTPAVAASPTPSFPQILGAPTAAASPTTR